LGVLLGGQIKIANPQVLSAKKNIQTCLVTDIIFCIN